MTHFFGCNASQTFSCNGHRKLLVFNDLTVHLKEITLPIAIQIAVLND